MKPYGKHRRFPYPDAADIREMAAKSSVGSLRGKGGDYRGSVRTKRAMRRWQKSRTRMGVKQELRVWVDG